MIQRSYNNCLLVLRYSFGNSYHSYIDLCHMFESCLLHRSYRLCNSHFDSSNHRSRYSCSMHLMVLKYRYNKNCLTDIDLLHSFDCRIRSTRFSLYSQNYSSNHSFIVLGSMHLWGNYYRYNSYFQTYIHHSHTYHYSCPPR